MMIKVIDDLDKLIEVMPDYLKQAVEAIDNKEDIVEFVVDLGRQPEVRFHKDFQLLDNRLITEDDINYIVSRVGQFGPDGRAGIAGTLHRISAIRTRTGKIVGLTLRVGRAVFGVLEPLKDIFTETGDSVLLLGKPGVGKTTILREVSRVLADEMRQRVIVVDTSNEIGGDGDIPHPAIGRARRMQVVSPEKQHDTMIEAVENHMPEVIVIDEIGREEEVMAARTIAERGVRLIATAHGGSLENVLFNPTLSDLVGGINVVTLSDEEARRRKTSKTVMERKGQPTFKILIEIKSRNEFVIHRNVAKSVDSILAGIPPKVEIRRVKEDGTVEIEESQPLPMDLREEKKEFIKNRTLKIYPFGLSKNKVESAIRDLGINGMLSGNLDMADFVIALKSRISKHYPQIRLAERMGKDIISVRSNTVKQIQSALSDYLGLDTEESQEVSEDIIAKTRQAALEVLQTEVSLRVPVYEELLNEQLEVIKSLGLEYEIVGDEIVIKYPGGDAQ
jgi:stage III sporulation protein SpoIIIAA